MNSLFERISANLIVDTLFQDSSLVVNTTYEYKICAMDSNDNPGKLSSGVQVTIVASPNSPPVITMQPRDTTILESMPFSLSVTAIGGALMTYEWYKGSISASTQVGMTNPYGVSSAELADSGSYICIVSIYL